MERAFYRRDAAYDGVFFVGVRTTGVFCCPSCPARKPLRQHIEFFNSAAAAVGAGYRACRRCRPLAGGRRPPWVGDLLDAIEHPSGERLRDADLRERRIDPIRVRRYFKRHYGMTFQAYQRSFRLGRARVALARGAAVTAVGLDHGYASSSGFQGAFRRTFGHSAGRRDIATGVVSRELDSPLGPLVAWATPSAVCLLDFQVGGTWPDPAAALRRYHPGPVIPGSNAPLEQLEAELQEYFSGKRQTFSTPIDAPGTSFQEAVWGRLLAIPCGHTVSYRTVAADVGRPRAVRAVGRANGQNRVCIVIPCHRVVNCDGRPGGYGGGLWRKFALLEHERQMVCRPAGRCVSGC